ncbi:MAG: outer membrane protein assembly factor BamC [Betaproteobacteria bacterium]
MTFKLRFRSLPQGRPVLALGLLLSLGACSSVGDFVKGDRIDYRSTGESKVPSLDVPPDLTQLSRDARYVVPGGTVTASGYQAGQTAGAAAAAAGASTAPSQLGDVRIERAGNQRWLVVKRAPEALWDTVREFWQEGGFTLTIEQANTGIIETDFAENRAKLPQDIIRRTIGKVVDGLYSTGERDKFRTRLERSSEGTEIYISHRGMVETVPNASLGSSVWQQRPADPELETEFLRRLMIKLGVPREQARSVATVTQQPVAQLAAAGSQSVLKINEGFDRAWRRVGLSLDRTGFTVEDRDRAQGLYFVRYVEPNADKKEPGFFARLFSSTPTATPLKYRISVRSEGPTSTVSVLNSEGAPDTSANATRIVQLIAEDLK